jgi:hypothetical protein
MGHLPCRSFGAGKNPQNTLSTLVILEGKAAENSHLFGVLIGKRGF